MASFQTHSSLLSLLIGVCVLLCCCATITNAFSYDIEHNRVLVRYAYAAYCPTSQIVGWNCTWCYDKNFKGVGTFYQASTEFYGYVGYHQPNNTIIVSFRGSDNIDNWLHDFDFIKVTYPGGRDVKVHAGFFNCWKAVRAQVHDYVSRILNSLCPTCRNIVSTGHSLGAAVAGFSALELGLNFTSVNSSLINFGMPRVGDSAFADLYDQHVPSSQRNVHNDDIVPHLPLVDQGFHHVAREIWEFHNTTGNFYITCDNSGEDPHCSQSIPAEKWRPSDHDVYMDIRNSGC